MSDASAPDLVTLMQGNPFAAPIYSGVNSPHCEDGRQYGVKHFGIRYEQITGGELQLELPLELFETVRRERIDVMLWTWYPQTHGSQPAPFHTKARGMARQLVENLPTQFYKPLAPTLSLKEDPTLRQLVDARLRNICGLGERRLCLLGRGGYTSVGKNWGNLWREDLPPDAREQGHECRDFIRKMLAKSKGWCFLLMEDRDYADSIKNPALHTFAYSDVFGEPEAAFAPFGRVMKCLASAASLCVGVPAGPYHFAAQAPALPTVGVWLEHLPSWYDEPRAGLLHVIGSHAAQRLGAPGQPGSFIERDDFNYAVRVLDTRTVPGDAVMAAVEELLPAAAWRPLGTSFSMRQ